MEAKESIDMRRMGKSEGGIHATAFLPPITSCVSRGGLFTVAWQPCRQQPDP